MEGDVLSEPRRSEEKGRERKTRGSGDERTKEKKKKIVSHAEYNIKT